MIIAGSSIKSAATIQAANSPRQTNMLKFINKTAKKQGGIRCTPELTYGISKDSPQHFKFKHTLSPANGYQFKYDNYQGKKNFQYFSQKHYIQMDGSSDKSGGFKHNFDKSYNKNKLCFHRKKGKLSDFMDHNGWMSKQFIIMGDQRNQTARSLKNRDRDSCIRTAHSKIMSKQKTMSLIRTNSTSQRTNSKISSNLLTQKAKIRGYRNQMATIISQRPFTTDAGSSRKRSNQFRDTSNSIRLPGSYKTLEEWNNGLITGDSINWKDPQQSAEQWKSRRCGKKFVNPETAMTQYCSSRKI